jgi:hypothetical protein
MIARFSSPCPGDAFLEVHPRKAADKPFYDPAKGMNVDEELGKWTIAGIMELDAHPDILTAIAHDHTLLEDRVELYPKTMNGWKNRGEREKVFWQFLDDFEVKV